MEDQNPLGNGKGNGGLDGPGLKEAVDTASSVASSLGMFAEQPVIAAPNDVALEQLSYSSSTHKSKKLPIIKSYSNVEPGTKHSTLSKKVTKKPHHSFVRNTALEQDLEREESMRRWIMLLNADEQIASGLQHVSMTEEN